MKHLIFFIMLLSNSRTRSKARCPKKQPANSNTKPSNQKETMSCETCEFCPPYKDGRNPPIWVEILVWDEGTNTYVGVDSLDGFDALYILRQGDVTHSFTLRPWNKRRRGLYICCGRPFVRNYRHRTRQGRTWILVHRYFDAETQVFSSYFTAKRP